MAKPVLSRVPLIAWELLLVASLVIIVYSSSIVPVVSEPGGEFSYSAIWQSLFGGRNYTAQVYWSYPNGTQYLKTVQLARIPTSGCLENAYVRIAKQTAVGYTIPCMGSFFYNPDTDPEKFALVSTYYYADYLAAYHREKMKLTFLPKVTVYLRNSTQQGMVGGATMNLSAIELYPITPVMSIRLIAHEFAHFVQRNIHNNSNPTDREVQNSPVIALYEGHSRYLPAFFTNNPIVRGQGDGVNLTFDLSQIMTINFPIPPRDKCEDHTICGQNLLHAIAGLYWDIKTYFESAGNVDMSNKLIYTAWRNITYNKEPITQLLTALINADKTLNNGTNKIALANIFIRRCPDCNITVVGNGVVIPVYVPK